MLWRLAGSIRNRLGGLRVTTHKWRGRGGRMRPATRLLAAGTLLALAVGCTRGGGDQGTGGAPSGGVATAAPATTQV